MKISVRRAQFNSAFSVLKSKFPGTFSFLMHQPPSQEMMEMIKLGRSYSFIVILCISFGFQNQETLRKNCHKDLEQAMHFQIHKQGLGN